MGSNSTLTSSDAPQAASGSRRTDSQRFTFEAGLFTAAYQGILFSLSSGSGAGTFMADRAGSNYINLRSIQTEPLRIGPSIIGQPVTRAPFRPSGSPSFSPNGTQVGFALSSRYYDEHGNSLLGSTVHVVNSEGSVVNTGVLSGSSFALLGGNWIATLDGSSINVWRYDPDQARSNPINRTGPPDDPESYTTLARLITAYSYASSSDDTSGDRSETDEDGRSEGRPVGGGGPITCLGLDCPQPGPGMIGPPQGGGEGGARDSAAAPRPTRLGVGTTDTNGNITIYAYNHGTFMSGRGGPNAQPLHILEVSFSTLTEQFSAETSSYTYNPEYPLINGKYPSTATNVEHLLGTNQFAFKALGESSALLAVKEGSISNNVDLKTSLTIFDGQKTASPSREAYRLSDKNNNLYTLLSGHVFMTKDKVHRDYEDFNYVLRRPTYDGTGNEAALVFVDPKGSMKRAPLHPFFAEVYSTLMSHFDPDSTVFNVVGFALENGPDGLKAVFSVDVFHQGPVRRGTNLSWSPSILMPF